MPTGSLLSSKSAITKGWIKSYIAKLRIKKDKNKTILAIISTFSHRTPYAIWLDTERNLIGRRTQSDRTADAIRSGGVRSTMTFRVLLRRESAVATLTFRTRIRAMHQHKTTDANEKKRILIDIYQQNIGICNKIVILFAQTTNYSYLCIVKRLIDCLG